MAGVQCVPYSSDFLSLLKDGGVPKSSCILRSCHEGLEGGEARRTAANDANSEPARLRVSIAHRRLPDTLPGPDEPVVPVPQI